MDKNFMKIDGDKSLKMLLDGNRQYMNAKTSGGNISPERRKETYDKGQSPYAVILTCSDARVIPEAIFTAGIGDLFVIRNGGNLAGEHELGSIEFALTTTEAKLVFVLGHTKCGALHAAVNGDGQYNLKSITDEIHSAIKDEKDIDKCLAMNVRNTMDKIKQSELIKELIHSSGVKVMGGIYHTDTGEVILLTDN